MKQNINWYWIIGILVLIAVGAGIYFLTKGSAAIPPAPQGIISPPPALPS